MQGEECGQEKVYVSLSVTKEWTDRNNDVGSHYSVLLHQLVFSDGHKPGSSSAEIDGHGE